MISRPDFIEKQFLVIFSYDLNNLRFHNENIIIEEDGKIKNQASLHKIFAIFLIGEATITTNLIKKLKSFWIIFILMKQNLEVIDVIGDDTNGNILLREKQYSLFKKENFGEILASHTITNKILNQENLLKKIRKKDEILKNTHKKLHNLAIETTICRDNKKLLWLEWNAAKYFFHEYYRELDWIGRYPRTKIDKNNVLLDMGYTFLFHFIEALLLLYGFDVYEWFYHTRFYQRKSLVCDIEEPFRPIIDEAIRKAFSLGQISEKDFWYKNGMYYLQPTSIKKFSTIFAKAILARKLEIYDYIRDFYRFTLDSSRELPYYNFS